MKTLLVLSQHPDLADAVGAALGGDQYRLIPRLGINEATPFLQPGAVDAILLDADQNQFQALWAIETLRHRLPQCPVVVFTPPGPWESEEQAYALGISQIIAKPVRPRLLATHMERIFQNPGPGTPPGQRQPTPTKSPAKRPSSGLNSSNPDVHRAPTRSLEVFRDFSAILSHSLCAEAMLKQFLLRLREILGVNRAAIFLRPPISAFSGKPGPEERRHFRSACAIGLPTGLLEHFELSFEAGIGGFLFREGRILRRDSDEVAEDPEMQQEFELLSAQVVVPILDRETLIGVAAFDGRVTGEPLGNAELELIFHLLEQLGLAVRNIWLHDQLGANHEMMANILRELSSACVLIGRDLAILHCNKAARSFFGKPGRKNVDLEFSDLPTLLASRVYQVLQTGTTTATFKFQPAEPAQAVYHVTIIPFQRESSPKPTSALLLVEDHSQAEHLQKVQAEAEQLRLVRTMAERLAHEVGNAMVPVSTHQQLLAAGQQDDEFLTSLSNNMHASVKRVSRRITQMRCLALEKCEIARSFPLEQCLDEAFEEAKHHQGAKDPQWIGELGSYPIILHGDHIALRHAFSELILNGLQANPNNPHVTIRLSSDTHGVRSDTVDYQTNSGNPPPGETSVTLEIEDAGPGFSDEVIKCCTEPFFTTKVVGMGLGLTVAKKIIEAHHGQLVLKNSPLGGGLVRVSLPMEVAKAPEPIAMIQETAARE